MKTFTSKILIINVLLLFIGSCTHERIELVEKTPEQEIIREIALLVGTVLKNPAVTNEVLDAMTIVDEFNELVSIPFLMGSSNNLKKNEIAAVSSFSIKNAGNTFFKNAVMNEFSSRKNDYPALSRAINERFPESIRLKSSAFHENDYLAELLEDDGYQIYFPYSQSRDIQEPLESYYVSYDPLNGLDRNEGFFFESGKENFVLIDEMDNDFIYDYPVFGIIPIDPCDMPGEPCDFTELVGYSDEEVVGFLPILPPVFPNEAQLIKHNFHHIHITDDKDMISSRIPWIKITGKDYMGFLASHQKLGFFRAGPDAGITITSDGNINVPSLKHQIAKSRIRVYYINKKKWYHLDGDFDADWKMLKNTQSMVLFSYHNLKFSSAEVTAGFKVGLTVSGTGTLVPTVEATRSLKMTIKEGGAKFRSIVELERRQVFLTNIGKAATGKEHVVDSVPYNVKRIGIIDYIFNHWHTSLVE